MLCFYRLSRYIINKTLRYRDNKYVYYICRLPYSISLVIPTTGEITVIKSTPKARVKYMMYYNDRHPLYSWFSYEYIIYNAPNKTITISPFGQTNIYRVVFSNGYEWRTESIKLEYDFNSCISRWYKKLIINTNN
jgi:hypothetical protein